MDGGVEVSSSDSQGNRGRMRRSSSCSSAMHFSAIEILFGFLIFPTSLVIPFWRGNSSLDKEKTPGAGSTLTTDWGRARGRNSRQKRSRPARRDQLRLLSIKQEQVKELDVSQTTRTSCRCCFMRSTANERPIPSRGLAKAYQLVNICTQAYILGTAHR